MPRFRVSEHRAWAAAAPDDAEPGDVDPDTGSPQGSASERPSAPGQGPEPPPRTATETFLEETFGSPRTARRFVTAALVVITFFGVVLAGGILGAADTPLFAHGPFEPVTDTERIAQYVAAGFVSEYHIEVRVGPQKTPDAWFQDDQAHIRLPSVAPDEPLYGLRIQVVRLDPHVEPFLMWALPEEGGRRMHPVADDGITQTYDVRPFREQGDYRVIFSSAQGAGSLDVKMQLAGAPVLGVQGALQDGPLLFALGLVLTGLSLGSLLLFSVWRRHGAEVWDPDDGTEGRTEGRPLTPPPATPQPPEGTDGFGRMEYGAPGVRRWSGPGDGVPESLAEGDGKGWVIRLD